VKVEYRTVMKASAYADNEVFEYLLADEPVFCCDEMQYAWGTTLIRFGYNSSIYYRSSHPDGTFCQGGRYLNQANGVYFDPPKQHDSALLIEYCPFCTEKIETHEGSRSEITWEKQTKEVTAQVIREISFSQPDES